MYPGPSMARVAVRLASILALTPLAVCVGGILAASSACSRPDAPPAPPPPTAAKLEQDLVDLALHDCFAADCERAYAHLAELPSGSPLRQSDAFRAVQYRYDADRLLRADVEQDLEKRRAALEAIASSRTAEASLRLGAAERISRLGVAPLRAGQELAVNALPGAATPAGDRRAGGGRAAHEVPLAGPCRPARGPRAARAEDLLRKGDPRRRCHAARGVQGAA